MKPHKHAEWVKQFVDGVEVQGYFNHGWVTIDELSRFDLPKWEEFRVKPREFVEGRYYPVVTDSGWRDVFEWTGAHFVSNEVYYNVSELKWLGDPLPEIEWPEGL